VRIARLLLIMGGTTIGACGIWSGTLVFLKAVTGQFTAFSSLTDTTGGFILAASPGLLIVLGALLVASFAFRLQSRIGANQGVASRPDVRAKKHDWPTVVALSLSVGGIVLAVVYILLTR